MRVAKLLVLLCFACSSSSGTDAGAGETDAQVPDTSLPAEDTGAGADDTGPALDAGGVDSGGVDSGGVDAGGVDSGGVDSGPSADAGPDSGGLAVCSADSPCEGACTGRSCSATWFCITDAPCTDDIAEFCGCDGVTFSGSSTCPGQPYASEGPCPTRGTSCDGRNVRCRIPTPVCRTGFVPEVTADGTCWTTRCVAIGDCACTSPEECPDPDNYTCRNDTGRCTPFL